MSQGNAFSHLKITYDGVLRSHRESPTEIFRVTYGPCVRTPLDLKSEALRVCQQMVDLYPGPYQLLYSGGSDSEFVARCLLELGVQFEPVIIRFERGYNSHDIAFAFDFCRKFGLSPRVLDLHVHRFFESGLAYDYAKVAQCASPVLLPHLWAIDQIDGFPIIAGGDPTLVRNKQTFQWEFWDEEIFFSWFRFLAARNRSGLPHFFQSTPELVLSLLLDPLTQEMLQGGSEDDSFQFIKLNVYKQYYAMNETPVPGYNGFERLLELFADYLLEFDKLFVSVIDKKSLSSVLEELDPEGYYRSRRLKATRSTGQTCLPIMVHK